MFTVRNISGQTAPYVTGIIRSKNRVQRAGEIKALSEPSGAAAQSPADKGSISYENAIKNYTESGSENQPRRQIIAAKDLMKSPVFTISSETTLKEAWKLIAEKRFRHLPVTDKDKRLCGLISDRDILRYFASKDAEDLLLVSKIMHTDILTADPETEVREIAKVLFEERIGCMPVVNQNHVLEGIITRSDILRTLLVKVPLELWL